MSMVLPTLGSHDKALLWGDRGPVHIDSVLHYYYYAANAGHCQSVLVHAMAAKLFRNHQDTI